jgi:hypothetical protein
MISITKEKGLFIFDFDLKSNELVFKISTEPNSFQKEVIKVKNNMVYTKDYHFSIAYLQKFINENKK